LARCPREVSARSKGNHGRSEKGFISASLPGQA
jgi:hypothetical protein